MVDTVGAWSNQEFPEQRGRFVVEFDAAPSATGIDAVVGLASGSAAGFTALAAIVRFNASGAIDVRAGSAYRADVVYGYVAGHGYHVRLSVDIGAHSYSVQVREGSADYTTIATGYPFRTEQAGVTGLDHVASEDDSTAGSLEVCDVSVSPSGGTCLTVSAGQGFVSLPVADATGYEAVTLSAQAGGRNIDAVFGLSAGPATTYSDIAAAVRFAPSGNIDVRDGDGYRADIARAYPTTATQLRLISDLATHTYSVFQDGPLMPGSDELEIARQYRFRTAQAAVSHLDHLSAVVDGDHGSAIICVQVAVSPGVYSREGTWVAAPLAGDEALLSNGATTVWADAAGRTLAAIDHGGRVATDPLGHGFVASIASSTLTVERDARPLVLDWRASVGVATNSAIRAVGGRADGGVTVAVAVAGQTTTLLLRFTGDGTLASTVAIAGSAVAIDGDQAVAAWQDTSNNVLWVTAYTADGAMIWGQAFAGSAAVTAIAVEPDHDVIFGGQLFSSIDFGGGAIRLVQTEDGPVNGFIVKLSNTGAHVFSSRNGYSTVTGLASNDRQIAMSGTRRTQFFYKQLAVFDAGRAPGDVAQLGDNGRGGAVAMAPSGRIWWTFEEQFQLFTAFPYLLSFPGG